MYSLARFSELSGFQSTPSARRATAHLGEQPVKKSISIHALREEGDTMHSTKWPTTTYFNPRPPRGGRRVYGSLELLGVEFQSTPSARRATVGLLEERLDVLISIHALREEGDPPSVPPYTRAGKISIHAPREEGDQQRPLCFLHFRDFNPRPPRGGRQEGKTMTKSEAEFQSTPSARRATP